MCCHSLVSCCTSRGRGCLSYCESRYVEWERWRWWRQMFQNTFNACTQRIKSNSVTHQVSLSRRGGFPKKPSKHKKSHIKEKNVFSMQNKQTNKQKNTTWLWLVRYVQVGYVSCFLTFKFVWDFALLKVQYQLTWPHHLVVPPWRGALGFQSLCVKFISVFHQITTN